MKCEGCGKELSEHTTGYVEFAFMGVRQYMCLWCSLGKLLNAILTDDSEQGVIGRRLLREGLDEYEKKHGSM